MPSQNCQIIVNPETGQVHFLRKMDRNFVDKTALAHSRQRPLPNISQRLLFFKESVRDAFRIDRGLVVLADENRLVRELAVVANELLALFEKDPPDDGLTIAALFLDHILTGKFDQQPPQEALRKGLALAASRSSFRDLEKVIADCIAASPFPRQAQWRFSPLKR